MSPVRVLIFHGYLLRGTGSNIYNVSLARALADLGHEVHLLCQERHPEALDLPPSVRVYNPAIGRVLPVYVADRYEDFDAVTFADLDDAAVEHYVAANVAAVKELAATVEIDVALANHAVMGPAILARGLEGRVPYAVKIHGSALEYTVRPDPERFLPYMLEGLRGASGILVGSRHTAESLWEVAGDPQIEERTRLGPPGVDVGTFQPRSAAAAAEALVGLADWAGHVPDELSGGQRQRVTIARALVNDPAIVWADEPTGDLDSENAEEVMQLMRRLNMERGLTFLIVTHDIGIGRSTDRIVRMVDGRIVEDNRTEVPHVLASHAA